MSACERLSARNQQPADRRRDPTERKLQQATRRTLPAESSLSSSARYHLTRTSSAAATGSAAGNLRNCFSHKEFERAAGSCRLQRLVRAVGERWEESLLKLGVRQCKEIGDALTRGKHFCMRPIGIRALLTEDDLGMIPFFEIGLHLKRGEQTEIVESVDGSSPHDVHRD